MNGKHVGSWKTCQVCGVTENKHLLATHGFANLALVGKPKHRALGKSRVVIFAVAS